MNSRWRAFSTAELQHILDALTVAWDGEQTAADWDDAVADKLKAEIRRAQDRRRPCACENDPCEYPVFGYWFCPGCGDHHRLPIASGPGVLCPVAVVEEAGSVADENMRFSYTDADLEEAARRLGGEHDPVW